MKKALQSLNIALTALKSQKSRTFLASLGIVIGIAAVIIIVAIGQGSQQQVMSVIAKMGENLVTINAGEMKRRGGHLRLTGNVTTLNLRDVDHLMQDVRGLALVAPFEIKQLKGKYQQSFIGTNVGKQILQFIPDKVFHLLFKGALTIIAIKLIADQIVSIY